MERQNVARRQTGVNGREFGWGREAAHSGQEFFFTNTQGGADACPGLYEVPLRGLTSLHSLIHDLKMHVRCFLKLDSARSAKNRLA